MIADVDDQWVTVREAAAVLGRNAETVRRWVWSGKVRARKVGPRLMLARGDLDKAGHGPARSLTLSAWIAERDQERQLATARRGSSAADLVIEDRRRRSGEAVRARR